MDGMLTIDVGLRHSLEDVIGCQRLHDEDTLAQLRERVFQDTPIKILNVTKRTRAGLQPESWNQQLFLYRFPMLQSLRVVFVVEYCNAT
jgi:hypothetical protein